MILDNFFFFFLQFDKNKRSSAKLALKKKKIGKIKQQKILQNESF